MNRDYLKMKTGYIHRPRIDALLEKGLQYPLVSVVAGPGYGKTQAVAGYAIGTGMRLVWLALEPTDSDAYRLLTHFTAAATRELPELAGQLKQTAIPTLLGMYDSILQLFSTELANGGPILLVLDNFEYVSSPQFFSFLQYMLRAELPNLHIIIISNEKLPIGSVISSRGQLRLSAEELGYTNEEIGELFALYGLRHTPEEIEKIAAETARWPLALHLICVHQKDGGLDAMKEMTHQQLAAELFNTYYFSEYEPELQTMLLKLSTFARFPLELVHMLAEDADNRFLEKLYCNAFIGYDYQESLFQFQSMYRAFLRHRQALVPEEEKRALYAFMGNWYRDHGHHFDALDCFWAIRDYQSYIDTAFLLPRVRHGMGATSEILNTVFQFPDAYARENPLVDFSKALLLLNALQIAKAEEILLSLVPRLEAAAETDADAKALLGDTCVTLADIRLLLNRDDGIQYMQKAAELMPNGCRIRNKNLLLVGNNSVVFLPDNSPGQLQHMEEYIVAHTNYSDRVTNGSGYGYEWLFLAQTAFLAERFVRSRECCFQAIAKAKLMEQHDIICNAYWDLMRTELYMGNFQPAKKWLDTLVEYVDTRRIAELYELRDCATSWFYLRVGDFDRVARWIAEATPHTDDVVDIGRNRIIIIYYLFEQKRIDEAYAEITRLEDIVKYNGRWHETSLLLMHKAIYMLLRGEKREAMALFKQVYDRMFHNDIMVFFAEFGKFTQRLVRAAGAQTEFAFSPQWLDAVYKKAGAFEKRAVAIKKAYQTENPHPHAFGLNARETEILRYIAQGMTRPEISQLLGTSLSNIKRYTSNIYAKLGANNRADAIYVATLNGLLGSSPGEQD